MSTNDDYTTRNLLDYFHHQSYCKLIGIDLSRYTNSTIPKQINLTGKSEFIRTLNLLSKSSNSIFVARNWNIVNDPSNPNYSVGNEIILSTEVLNSNLCNYYDAYIFVMLLL